jgi:hypothetical protein
MAYTPVSHPDQPAKIDRRQRIEEYLLTHPNSTNPETAAYFGCSERTITRVRQAAIKKGFLTPSYFDRVSDEPPPVTTEGAEVLRRELEKMRGVSGEPLTDTESLQMLANLARDAAANRQGGMLRDAILAHKKISSDTDQKHLGPPPPLTDEDKIQRTADILDVVGPILAALAHLRQPDPSFANAFAEELHRLQSTQHSVPPQAPMQTVTPGEGSLLPPEELRADTPQND